MKKTGEDWINEYYTDYFKGHSVRFIKNKFTGETRINADDVCRICGVGDNFEEFISSDKGLDFINEWKKEHPDMPFFGKAIIKTNN